LRYAFQRPGIFTTTNFASLEIPISFILEAIENLWLSSLAFVKKPLAEKTLRFHKYIKVRSMDEVT